MAEDDDAFPSSRRGPQHLVEPVLLFFPDPAVQSTALLLPACWSLLSSACPLR
jgi:hypothetical protein